MKTYGWEEFLEWRRLCNLPPVEFDQELAEFAQRKAEYRARHQLHDGHDGPPAKTGWREGTGEAKPTWGFLCCCIEEDMAFAGTGLALDGTGERYMVIAVRGGSGRALIPRNNIPIHPTAYLTPDAPVIKAKP